LIQDDPPVWLYSIDVPSTPASKLRLAAYPKPLNFERDSTGAVITYSPGEIIHEDVRSDTEGSVPKIRLTLQNITREIGALIEFYGGLTGQAVRACCLKLSTLPDGLPIVDERYEILESATSETEAVLTIGNTSLTSKQFPDRRISRTYCGHAYGRAGCGYDTTRPGAMTTCTKLLDGENGCIDHGDDEVAASLTRRHPQRFLAFVGVPRVSGVGVT